MRTALYAAILRGVDVRVMLERERAPHAGTAHRDAVLPERRKRDAVDAVEDVGAPDVEALPFGHGERGVDALGPRQCERGARALHGIGRGHRQDAAERFAVVADAHRAVALEAAERDAMTAARFAAISSSIAPASAAC